MPLRQAGALILVFVIWVFGLKSSEAAVFVGAPKGRSSGCAVVIPVSNQAANVEAGEPWLIQFHLPFGAVDDVAISSNKDSFTRKNLPADSNLCGPQGTVAGPQLDRHADFIGND